MVHPLLNSVHWLRSRVRRLSALRGISRCVASVVGLVLLLGVADYWIRFSHPATRILSSLLVVAACLYAVHRFLFVPWRWRPSDVDVSRWVERRFPELGDRLSSAVAFVNLQEDDPTAGSLGLRRVVIQDMTREVAALDLSQVIDPRPVYKSVLCVVGVSLLGVVLAVCDVTSARTALARLAGPLSEIVWPRANRLVFTQPPTRIASGHSFEARLVDRGGKLPAEVRMHYRYERDGIVTQQIESMRREGNAMIARKPNVDRPFDYRAEGGDDASMPWFHLEVVPPPRVAQCTITLYPPAYTGWGPVQSDKRIEALRGTRVQMTGAATNVLRGATLTLEYGDKIPAKITQGGRGFSIAADDFVIDQSGSYWLELVDADQVVSGSEDRHRIQAVTDTPPRAFIQQPDRDILVTPDAVVPLEVLVQDNLAVHEIALAYMRSDRADDAEQVIVIYEGPEHAVPSSHVPPGRIDLAVRQQVAEYEWNLSSLALLPETQIALYAQATDYQPASSRSPSPIHIKVVTPEELLRHAAQQQDLILEQIALALNLQRQLRGQISDLELAASSAGQLDQPRIDHLQAVRYNQRDVVDRLAGPQRSATTLARHLLHDLNNCRVPDAEMERRMAELVEVLTRLGEHVFPTIDQYLTDAWKESQAERNNESARQPDSMVAAQLAQAEEEQDAVIHTVQQLMDDFSQGVAREELAGEMRGIYHAQAEVEQKTRRQAQQTFTRPLQDLSAQELAELGKVAQRQADVAERFQHVKKRLDAAGGQLESDEQLSPETLEDAASAARQLAIEHRMREAARHVDQNQVAQALELQRSIATDLASILDMLSRANHRDGARPQGEQRTSAPGMEQNVERPGGGPSRPGSGPRTSPDRPNEKRQPGQEGTAGGTTGEPAPESRTAAGQRDPARPDRAQLPKLLDRAWGHLPPRAREELLQWSSEEFLPKYELQIERYFQRLAEEPVEDPR